MTLTEYLNQSEPSRIESGQVILQDSEVKIVSRIKRKNHRNFVKVFVPLFGYYYIIIEGTRTLRTTDEFGNPKGYSVFSYIVPPENLNQNCSIKSL